MWGAVLYKFNRKSGWNCLPLMLVCCSVICVSSAAALFVSVISKSLTIYMSIVKEYILNDSIWIAANIKVNISFTK